MDSIETGELEKSHDQAENDLQRPKTLNVLPAKTLTAERRSPSTSVLPISNTAGSISVADTSTLASKQLAAGFLQIIEPPVCKARSQLKELISKQNKIYVDLSAEKFKLDNAEIAQLQEMMNNIKVYREKLLRIKKQMQSIYQRTKSLKKRAHNIEACKQKELQRKQQKQQQEEALIGK